MNCNYHAGLARVVEKAPQVLSISAVRRIRAVGSEIRRVVECATFTVRTV
jgi:hypothetical protein